MSSSTFAVPVEPVFAPRRALAYDVDETPLPGLVYPEAAPAGLWSTPTDLARFLVEVELARDGCSHAVSQRVATRMTTGISPVGPPLARATARS